ncbi:MAG TPA: NAD(P)/FAD-dependent oxidoreductase [Bryobacteraceae bacterium]|jgi:phytoene dehydrogenase-like protein|nr:NAD(P)/FAD-dependent oxidoreductase [Bryobacteraceae bacterium]
MGKRSAVVVGSGPNGLSAAIVLAEAGLDVEVREAAGEIGGAARTGELTLPGFWHDLGSAVHPMAISSPFFQSLPLAQFGLRWIWSPAALAHPFDDGTAVTLERDVRDTAEQLGVDGPAYRRLYEPVIENWTAIFDEVFRPPTLPRRPVLLMRFGRRAVPSCYRLTRSAFLQYRAPALMAGSTAHSALRLESPLSAAFAMVLGGAGHAVGWPVPEGGSQSISRALAGYFESLGGRICTNARVERLEDAGRPDLLLCDVSPRQFLSMAAHRLKTPFRKLLARYRYAPGVFKMDWALREPIPWTARECRRALTVHLGGTIEEIAVAERDAWQNRPPYRPFVLLAQPSLFDTTRAPEGRHTAWAYCHVPNSWTGSAVDEIEKQIERFAPGFRECVLARRAHSTADMQHWDENLVGGDVVGGAYTPEQFLFRPTWRQYGTPLRGVYLCSASTPPGGSVHGLCGYWAARRALRSLRRH